MPNAVATPATPLTGFNATNVVKGDTTVAVVWTGANIVYGLVIGPSVSVAVVGTYATRFRPVVVCPAGTAMLNTPEAPVVAKGSPASHMPLLFASRHTVAPEM